MLTYSRSRHRFFDDLVTFLSSTASLGIAFDAHRVGIAHAYQPTDYLTLEGIARVSNIEVRFFPYPVMQILVANGWPTEIYLDDRPLGNPAPPHPLWLTGLQGLHGSIIGSAFVHYFETIRPVVEQNHGTDPRNWPSVWDFARVVRNAFAHAGQITFRNLAAPGVSWRSLSYNPTDNGRQILYQDVTAVEIILLMEDMDTAV